MNINTPFPLDQIPTIQQEPENFRLLTKLKPMSGKINERVGDEKPMVFLDVETTGFNAESDKVIEFGFVRVDYSPSEKRITSVDGIASLYNDPGFPIPEEITQLTGITDADVAGQRVTPQDLDTWLFGDPLVVAHNAPFDCKFTMRFAPERQPLHWLCSQKDIPWKSKFGMGSQGLEYLCLKHGFFYEAHRASIDCLALCQLFVRNPAAFSALLSTVEEEHVWIRAYDVRKDQKDHVKERGYRWNEPVPFVWQKMLKKSESDAELEFLKELTGLKWLDRRTVTNINPRTRFAPESFWASTV